MLNLFEKNAETDFDNKVKFFKKYFSGRISSEEKRDEKIQRHCNEFLSLKRYQNVRNGNAQKGLLEAINQHYDTYKSYLGMDEKAFVETFSRHFWHNIFETVMAHWLNEKFKLVSHTDSPDLIFSEGFVECTTNASSRLDHYDLLLPTFDSYCEVILSIYPKVLHGIKWFWKDEIESKLKNMKLKDEDKNWIINKILGIFDFNKNKEEREMLFNESFKKISSWIELNIYISLNFNEIIPDCIHKKLELIGITNEVNIGRSRKLEVKIENDYRYPYLRSIVTMLLGKLGKEYFNDEKMGIVAISLAVFNSDNSLLINRELMPYLSENLQYQMDVEIGKFNCEVKREKIQHALKNLYAILIDTTWYNWFPEIAGANMPDGYDNTYGIIYNTNVFSQELKSNLDKKIRNTVPYEADVFLLCDFNSNEQNFNLFKREEFNQSLQL